MSSGGILVNEVVMLKAFCLMLSCALFATTVAQAAPKANHRPKLVLVISVDQFSAGLFQRFGKDLPGGLGLLQKRGVVFTEAYHDHAFTETGPGHSVLLSGRFPSHTGIVENNWYDRALGRSVYCVSDESVHSIGQPEKPGVSPLKFIGTTLGDWLQAQVKGSRVFSLSGKDRAAVLMAGRKPTAVFWFEGTAGFNTSTAYAERRPQWLATFDEELHQRFLRDNWTWTALGPWSGVARTAEWTLPGGQIVRNGLPRVVHGAGMPLDKDFGELAVVKAKPHHGIVRIANLSARQQGPACIEVLKRFEADLLRGAIVTVQAGHVRVRACQDDR